MKVGDTVIFIAKNRADYYFIFGETYKVIEVYEDEGINRISVVNKEGLRNGWNIDMFVNIGRGHLTELDRLIYDIKDDV